MRPATTLRPGIASGLKSAARTFRASTEISIPAAVISTRRRGRWRTTACITPRSRRPTSCCRSSPASNRLRPLGNPRRPMTPRAAVIVLAAILASFAVRAPAAGDRYEKEFQPLLDAFMRQQEIPGLAIAIVENNQVVYARGFGRMSLDHGKG